LNDFLAFGCEPFKQFIGRFVTAAIVSPFGTVAVQYGAALTGVGTACRTVGQTIDKEESVSGRYMGFDGAFNVF
jgi:hypothetical protein